MNEQETPEVDVPLHGRELLVNGQRYLTDLPEGVEPFGVDAHDATTDNLNPKDLDKLLPKAYTIYFADKDQSEPYVVARSVIMRQGSKGMVVDSECFTPTFGKEDAERWTFLEGSEGLLLALGYELTSDESGSYISGIPTPETLRAAAAEQGVEVEFFEEKEIRSPEYLATIAEGKYPVSYAYFDHDIGDDHITAFVLGGVPMKAGLQRVAQRALGLDRAQQDKLTANIDAFTNLYRGVISAGVDINMTQGKTGREWVHESGKQIGLTETEVEDMLQTGIAKAQELATATVSD